MDPDFLNTLLNSTLLVAIFKGFETFINKIIDYKKSKDKIKLDLQQQEKNKENKKLKQNLNINIHQQKIMIAYENGKKINVLLERLLEHYNCDRAFVYVLHNGDSYNAALPFEKVSCSHMVTANKHIPNIIKMYQSMPISLFSDFFLHFWGNNGIGDGNDIYSVPDNSKEPRNIESLLEATKTKSSFYCRMNGEYSNGSRKMLGAVGFSFVKRNENEESINFTENELEYLKETTLRISSLIDIDDIKQTLTDEYKKQCNVK